MPSLIEDITEYTGIPYEDVVKNVTASKDLVEYRKDLWNRIIKEPTRNNIWEYYRSDEYSASLFWQVVQMQNKPIMPQVVASILKSTLRGYVSERKLTLTDRRILIYGCGDGMVALGLKQMGYNDITLADIPHQYNRFLQFISSKYNLGFKFVPIEIWNEYPLDQRYDFIICDEVLEHIWDPESTLLHIGQHMDQYGYLYLSTCFNDIGEHNPSHLAKNGVFRDVDKWLGTVESAGLKRTFRDETGEWKIWQKT